MENKLLYELEYQVNELRKIQLNKIEYNNMSVKHLLVTQAGDIKLREQQLSNIEHNNMTIKELLDLGFDNCFIRLDNNGNKQWFNLGFKDIDRNDNNKIYYESNDFGLLNEKQLSCMVRYVNDEISDYNYLQVSVELVNESDKKYFIESEEKNNE